MAITNAGFAAMSDLLGDVNSVAAFEYLALGDDDTAFAVTQTTLVSELTDSGLERAGSTNTLATTSVADDTLQLTYTWTATGTKTIKEVAVLNAASAGTMLCRQVLGSARALTSGNTYTLTIKVSFA